MDQISQTMQIIDWLVIAGYAIGMLVLPLVYWVVPNSGIYELKYNQGFHESLDGVRKRMYWPPLFKTAPWWPFNPEFRDACARSVGLTSLGKLKARYAVLYPQYELEQSDIFKDAFSEDDPVLIKLNCVASAICQSGEAFEFVFPENLENMAVGNDLLTIGDAEYSELLVIGEFSYAQESLTEIQRLLGYGGKVKHDLSEHIIFSINSAKPSWTQAFDIECRDRKKIRIYEYEYPDGKLFALFNTDSELQVISIHSDNYLTQWDPVKGNCTFQYGNLDFCIESESIKYFSVSSRSFGNKIEVDYNEVVPIESPWAISTDKPNMARLLNIQFYHKELGWLSPELNPSASNTSAEFIPSVFKGQTQIKMRGEFNLDSISSKLGIVYEQNHFANLFVNERSVDLNNLLKFAGWDDSCMYVEVAEFCHLGSNLIEGMLEFEKFETTLFSHGFFTERPVMPTCDVCIAGTFKSVNGKLLNHSDEKFNLPLNLSEIGWVHYSGRVIFTSIINVDQSLSGKIRGLQASLVSEDAIEVILDGNSLGCRIVEPYKFEFDSVTAGQHKLELVISTTSGNILDEPSPSGLLKVEWLC